MGAGNLGRRIARVVRPALICDNNSSLWGSKAENVSVVSPVEAVKRYPEATFVVAIWHPSRNETMIDRIQQLKALGALKVVSFYELFEEYGNPLLPNLFWERPDYYAGRTEQIARGRALLDAAGQQEFDRQMRLRGGDFFGQVIDSGTQYFPHDLFGLTRNEVFIDCGA